MPIAGTSIEASARRILLDPAPGTTWDGAAMLKFINEGIRAIVGLKPDAAPELGTLTLTAGVDQTLPALGTVLMDIRENVASGSPVSHARRDLLDVTDPGWRASTPTVDVAHFMFDPRTPRRFQVYPPNTGAGQVRALYGAVPTAMAALAENVPLPDVYEAPLITYVLSRAYAENTDRQDLAKSEAYGQQWPKQVAGIAQGIVAVAAQQQVAGST